MTPFGCAHTALALLAIDPALGGLVLRARASAVRTALTDTLPAHTRLHPTMGREALEGGIDVSATLSSGTLTQTRGLLAREGPFVLGMAERADPSLAARLAAMLDDGGRILIALDEGIEEEALLPALSDRLAFHVDLEGCSLADITAQPHWPAPVPPCDVRLPDDLINTLTLLALRLGISSLRAVRFALRAIRAYAALNGRLEPVEGDIAAAVALVFSHRATQMPAEEIEDTPEPPPPEDLQEPHSGAQEDTIPQDILLDAVLAMLPPDLLAKLKSGGAARSATGSGAGQRKTGNRRGRPLPARDGGPQQGRVDLIATLRAAVPWQTLRRRTTPTRSGPIIRRSDLRYKRYIEHSDRLLIFAVDASGSAAIARMGEAKGAIELLLAEAYARRDHVALIAFRGTQAEILLEPTRSLVQTKRKLAALPGGGGTPLAAGIMAAQAMAVQARRKGLSPTVVLLTDGRANIALDGAPDRTQAATDAQQTARALRGAGIGSIIIDTGRRPERALAQIADVLGGPYLALPRADARRLSAAVTGVLEA